MNEPIKQILCPVDLSENSVAAIELASDLAKQHGATLTLFYVAPQWLPEETMLGNDFVRQQAKEDKAEFMKLRPSDLNIAYEHKFLEGNAGPEIVRESKSSDLVVMSTHGYTGILRFLMGSVAQYVLRNAKCPVVLLRNRKLTARKKKKSESQSQPYVTEIMRQVAPVQGHDRMANVLADLKKADETAAPVVDATGTCIGILTLTDIQRYRDLKKRFEERDESVIDEVLETDPYGQRRTYKSDFDQVKRHMTAPVITIQADETCEQAFRKFEAHPNINHLVILDEAEQPVGIAGAEDLVGYEYANE